MPYQVALLLLLNITSILTFKISSSLALCTDNVTVIPWTVSIQNGEAISSKDNKIIVQQDGYYMVFSQVEEQLLTLWHCNSIAIVRLRNYLNTNDV